MFLLQDLKKMIAYDLLLLKIEAQVLACVTYLLTLYVWLRVRKHVRTDAILFSYI
jgi:hypothetical protein